MPKRLPEYYIEVRHNGGLEKIGACTDPEFGEDYFIARRIIFYPPPPNENEADAKRWLKRQQLVLTKSNAASSATSWACVFVDCEHAYSLYEGLIIISKAKFEIGRTLK